MDYKTKPSGHATRNYNGKCYSTLGTLIPGKTLTNLREFTKEQDILLPLMLTNLNFQPSGDFSMLYSLAAIVRNGEIEGQTGPVTMTGNYLEALNQDFVGVVESDLLAYRKKISDDHIQSHVP